MPNTIQEGVELPAVGSDVLFKVGSSCEWELHVVTGYRVVEAEAKGPDLYYVFIKGRSFNGSVDSERLLSEVRTFTWGHNHA
jgi:hypothetical protein